MAKTHCCSVHTLQWLTKPSVWLRAPWPGVCYLQCLSQMLYVCDEGFEVGHETERSMMMVSFLSGVRILGTEIKISDHLEALVPHWVTMKSRAPSWLVLRGSEASRFVFHHYHFQIDSHSAWIHLGVCCAGSQKRAAEDLEEEPEQKLRRIGEHSPNSGWTRANNKHHLSDKLCFQ